MPHERNRHLFTLFKSQASFWPVIGVMGLRQVGKSTFLRNQIKVPNYYTFDDDDIRKDASNSAKSFLAKIGTPVTLDEAQKVIDIFDAIKSRVDKKRIPGQFILSGSSKFNQLDDIRESLTGRIGNCLLFPMTLAEIHQKELEPKLLTHPLHSHRCRFKIEDIAIMIQKGGLPIPAFVRNQDRHRQYFQSWLDTTISRDLARAYGRNYDPDLARDILKQMSKILAQGEKPDSSRIDIHSRVLKKYLIAMQTIFLIQKIRCHEKGFGYDVYMPSDSGIALYLMDYAISPGITQTLVNIYLLNEIQARSHYAGKSYEPQYYKSRTGAPIDLVWQGIPIKFAIDAKITGWDERALRGAMKKLGSKIGIIAAPTDLIDIPKSKSGIAVVPWSYWS